jgi:hypothetical protein
MSSSETVFRGIVHGKTIHLDIDAGLPDGQEVRVIVQPAVTEEKLSPGEYLRRSAGAWADDPEDVDEFIEWNRKQREIGGRPEME